MKQYVIRFLKFKGLNEEMLVYNEKIIIFSKEIQEAMKNKNISADCNPKW